MAEPLIEVEKLTFGYGERTILNDISFRIDSPGFYCIIGPNGVGKSTLIRCITGHIKPDSGSVRISGKDVRGYRLDELAKIVGYVPVMNADFNVMTVLDTVLIGRYARQKWRTTSEDLAVAHGALECMEIGDLAMRYFSELSAGQRQKVSLARGLVQEPEILILDEPTSNLDVRHQMYVSAFLKTLSGKTGMTILMISHDLNLAAKFSDQVLVMEPPGRLYGMGSPSEIVTAEMIGRVYGVPCEIIDDHGSPHVILQIRSLRHSTPDRQCVRWMAAKTADADPPALSCMLLSINRPYI